VLPSLALAVSPRSGYAADPVRVILLLID